MTNLILGILFGALASWVITHFYHVASAKSETLQYFEHLLTKKKWKKEYLGHTEFWQCETKATFQIHTVIDDKKINEEWATRFPDPNATIDSVYLKIGGTIVKEILFASLDGGRIFVPLPDRRIENEKIIYFWNLESIEVKVCRLIGTYDHWKNLEGIAERTGIEIVK